jgi:hypothetical protein
MPHQKGRLAKSADKKNTIMVSAIVAGKETVFARVEANLGPQFRIVVFDKDTKKIIKAFAISRKPKHHLPLKINDIVLLSAVPNDGEVGEIMGRVGTAGEKETKALYDEGRIHASVYDSSMGCSDSMAKALNDIFEPTESKQEDIWDEKDKVDVDAI